MKTLFKHSFLSALFVFAIGIILSCQSKYEQCDVTQRNEQAALYNDILIQIVEKHLYHRYLGNDFTNLSEKIDRNEIDSTEYNKQLIELHNNLYKNTEKHLSIYLVDTLCTKVDTLFGLHQQNYLGDVVKNYDSVLNLNFLKKNGISLQELSNSDIRYVQSGIKATQLQACSFKVKSVMDLQTNDIYGQIGVILLSKVCLNKQKRAGLIRADLICNGYFSIVSTGLLYYIEKEEGHWKIVDFLILGMS